MSGDDPDVEDSDDKERSSCKGGGEGGDGEDEYEDTYKENNDTDGEDGVMTIEVRMVMMDGNNYDENEDEDCKG